MKKNDFISSKNLSKEIERVMKEDQKILQKRKDERRQNMINTFKKKQKQEIEHFKSSYETILINIQNKWSDRLEEERKKMNIIDARNDKKNTVIVTEQKINVNTKEPEGSIKARVNPKSKTNREMKGKLKDGILNSLRESLVEDQESNHLLEDQESNHKETDQFQDE